MEKTVKVLHVINGADLGGISTFILNYYMEMDRQKFHFDFCMYDNDVGVNGKKLQELGSRFYTVPSKKHLIKYSRILRNILKNGNYDVIHVHTNTSSYITLWIAKKMGIRVRVAHAHSAVVDQGLVYRIKAAVGRILIPKVATELCPCSMEAGKVVFGSAKVTIVPNAIKTKEFKYNSALRTVVRNELNLNDNQIVLGMVGRLSDEKNVDFAIDIVKRMLQEDNKYKLIIVGDGVLRDKLEEKVKRLGILGSVRFLGQMSDVKRLYQAFDIFLLPSKFEGFPISALEAISAGLPIVLSDRITKDIDFCNQVHYASIENNAIENWITTIKDIGNHYVRSDGTEVKKNGYDIKDAVHILENIYSGQ